MWGFREKKVSNFFFTFRIEDRVSHSIQQLRCDRQHVILSSICFFFFWSKSDFFFCSVLDFEWKFETEEGGSERVIWSHWDFLTRIVSRASKAPKWKSNFKHLLGSITNKVNHFLPHFSVVQVEDREKFVIIRFNNVFEVIFVKKEIFLLCDLLFLW